MAVTDVVVKVAVRNQRALADLQKRFTALEQNVAKLNSKLPAAANGIRRTGKAAAGANSDVSKLVGGLKKLAIAYGAVRAASAAIQAGIDRTESVRRIQFLARGYGEVQELSEAAARSAKRFGVSQTEANKALANTYARLRPVGVSLKDIESTYAGFNTAARISGATAVESEQAFRQLAQALGSGALRGDEFRSVAEQVPLILTAVSKETGIAQGALRDYAAEGKLTSDIVIRALKRIETEGADQLAEALNGPQQKIKDFQNASEDLAVAFSQEFIPEMSDALIALTETIRALVPALKEVGRIAAAVFRQIANLIQRANDLFTGAKRAQAEILADAQAQKQTREKFGIFGSLSGEAQDYRARVKAAQLKAFDDTQNPIVQRTFGSGAGTGTSGGGGGITSSAGTDKAAKAAAKAAAETARRLRDSKQLLEVLNAQLKIQQAVNPIQKIALESELDKLEINQKYDNLLSEETNELIRQNLERARALELESALLDEKEKQKDLGTQLGKDMAKMFLDQSKANEKLTETEELTRDIAKTVASDLSRGIQGLIQGTTTLNDIASQLLSKLGGMFLDAAFSGMFKGMGIKGFADGGSPPVNKPSIVGEKGPEIFVPSVAGNILPNDVFEAGRAQLQGGSSNMSGADAAFSENQASLGASTAVVQRNAEAVKMQQTLSNSAVKVEVDTVRVADLDVVTVEQFQAGMATTARQARAQVFSDMRNKPSTRSSLGMR